MTRDTKTMCGLTVSLPDAKPVLGRLALLSQTGEKIMCILQYLFGTNT